MGVQTYINRHGQNKWSHVSPGFICFSSFSSLACMPEMCLICEVELVSPCNADTGSRDSHHNEFTDFNLDQIPGWAFDRIEGMSRMYRSDFRARSKAVNLCGWEWSVDEIPTRISPLSQINYHLSKNNVDFFYPHLSSSFSYGYLSFRRESTRVRGTQEWMSKHNALF